jgi:hypothetical protein
MSLIKQPHELQVRGLIKALIYGPPGTGKSTLALGAPDCLEVDCDRGLSRVDPRHHPPTIEVTCWEDCTGIFSEDLTPFKTIVIDTIGKMLMYMNEYIGRMNSKYLQNDGTLTTKAYGVRKIMFQEFLKKAEDLGKHIVFVAHDKEDKKGDVVFARPDIGGSSSADLLRELDLVGYIVMVGNKRTITFNPTENFYGKNTCGLPPSIEIPDVTKFKNNLMTKFIEDFEKSVDYRTKMMREYRELMQDFETRIEGVDTVDKANEVYAYISNHTGHIWESLFTAKSMAMAKAIAMGYKPNKATKLFEGPPPVIKEQEHSTIVVDIPAEPTQDPIKEKEKLDDKL